MKRLYWLALAALLLALGVVFLPGLFESDFPIIEAMHGQTLSPALGQGVTLTLPGNPEVDRDWVLEEVDAAILQPDGEMRYEAAAMEGAEGRLVWRFVAQSQGETTLRLSRRGEPSWEALGPFVVTIRVGE